MRTLAATVLAAALGAGAASAQQPARHQWGFTHHFKGTVQAVEPTSGVITVRDKKGQTQDFRAGTDVKVTRGGASVPLDALNVGDQVSVSYKKGKAAPRVERVKIREKTPSRRP